MSADPMDPRTDYVDAAAIAKANTPHGVVEVEQHIVRWTVTEVYEAKVVVTQAQIDERTDSEDWDDLLADYEKDVNYLATIDRGAVTIMGAAQ